MCRSPCGFEIFTVTGVAIPITLGCGVKLTTEWDDISRKVPAGTPARMTSITEITAKNFMAFRIVTGRLVILGRALVKFLKN